MVPQKINGTKINYYFVCHRKLWLFVRQMQFENESNPVDEGKFISETTYTRKEHEIQLGDAAVLDFFDSQNKVVHEVKKSTKMEEAHLWQLKYYLYYLKNLGVEGVKGKIDYPKQKKTQKVLLTEEDEKKIESMFKAIKAITSREKAPDKIEKKFCKKCAYYEFCWA